MSSKLLASVGVKYGTVKREKLVLYNRKKWRRLVCRVTAGAQGLTDGHSGLGHISGVTTGWLLRLVTGDPTGKGAPDSSRVLND